MAANGKLPAVDLAPLALDVAGLYEGQVGIVLVRADAPNGVLIDISIPDNGPAIETMAVALLTQAIGISALGAGSCPDCADRRDRCTAALEVLSAGMVVRQLGDDAGMTH